jgi:hypothetical protein
MKAVVFLGPSLELDEARRILPDAVYLPPVAQGDLITALADHAPEVVGIVDGVFYQALPVWHKEIVYALEVGVRVLGAASMGALRAAECDAFGMVGVGEVYRRYASAMLAADDEVALAHADADHGWQKLSEPLVNVRATLEAEIKAGRVDASAAEAFVAAARPIWFPKRTVAYLAEAARAAGVAAADVDRIVEALLERYVDVKRADALELLETIASGSVPANGRIVTSRSMVFEAMRERDRKVTEAGVRFRLEDIARHAAAHRPLFMELRDTALNRSLALRLAHEWGVEADEAQVAAEIARLRARFRLRDDERLATWLRENDLTDREFHELALQEATLRVLRDWRHVHRGLRLLVKPVLDELRLRGEYAEWKARTAAAALLGPAPDRAFDPAERVRAHARATGWNPDGSFVRYAEENGFASPAELLEEIDSGA